MRLNIMAPVLKKSYLNYPKLKGSLEKVKHNIFVSFIHHFNLLKYNNINKFRKTLKTFHIYYLISIYNKN